MKNVFGWLIGISLVMRKFLLADVGGIDVVVDYMRDREAALIMIKDRLSTHFMSDINRCGGKWRSPDGYAAMHKSILNQPVEDRRLLVAVPHLSGLADRIIGFATTFMIAFLTGRAFQMGRRRELPILEKAFESPFINWTREQDPDWLLEPLKLKVDRRNYNESVLASKEYWAVNTLDDWRFQDRLIREDLSVLMGGDTQTTLMVSNRGKTIRMFENLHYRHRLTKIGLTPYTAFGCMTNYLIQPRPEIFLPVAKQFEFMSRNQSDVLKISIQVRVGDWAWADKDHQTTTKNFKYFFRCARAIEAWAMAKGNYSDVKWYLATESMPLRQAAVKAWGDKVVTSLNTTIEHSAKESSVCNGGADADHKAAVGCDVTDPGFLAAAAEWWMIGYADYHVVTRWSGYGRSGAFRTITSNSLYTIHDTHVTCSEDNYSPLDEIMYDWSGI